MTAETQTSAGPDTHRDWRVEVFYDGDCPLCVREIGKLMRLDRKGRIRFTNIAAGDFDPSPLGIDDQALMDRIHGRLPDGTWIAGVEVFRRMYSAVGLGWVLWPTRIPGISWLADKAYAKFAANRSRWTGRCEPGADACSAV